jgi:hypothetical protein
VRKVKYPSWNDWQIFVEQALEDCLKNVPGVPGYDISGNETSTRVSVKTQNSPQGSQPYVQAILSNIQDGWDEDQTARDVDESYNYTDIGGNVIVQSRAIRRERLGWTIEIMANDYNCGLKIANAIKNYLGKVNTLTVNYRDKEETVFSSLGSYSVSAQEASTRGAIEFWRFSFMFELSIKSESYEQNRIVPSISSLVLETTYVQGDNSTDEETFTLT